MDRELTRTPEATSESTPRWSVGGLLIAVGEVGPRLYVRWRVRLTPSGTSGRRRLAEQHVFAITGADGRISALDLLCSGFVTQADHGR